MTKVSKLINLPVISKSDNVPLGRIHDVLYNPKTMQVIGYYVSTGVIIKRIKFVYSSKISNINEKRIFVENKDCLIPHKNSNKLKKYKLYQKDTAGSSIIMNGDKVGSVSDMIAQRGKIFALEVSNGFAEDILKGRKNININNSFDFGNNNIEIND